jgi:apolipoprotein N-acyltransferase
MRFLALKENFSGISLVLISATLLVLSFLPYANLGFFTWFAFVPLFFTLKNKSRPKVFFLYYLSGVIFWSGIIYWLIHVTFIGLILIVLYLALYFGTFGLIISLINSRLHAFTRLLFIPGIWVLLEYLRSHLFGGFGWALLGYSQYLNLPIIQVAHITGVWGISFLVMLMNVLIYSMLDARFSLLVKKQKPTSPIINYALALVLLFLSLGYGFYKLYCKPKVINRKSVRISVIQGNIPQAIKWEEAARGKIFEEYQRLSRLAAYDLPDLVIWPEAALPGILGQDEYVKKNLQEFVSNIRIPFLVGAVNLDSGNYYNSAMLISRQGEFIQRYDKLHLVPFGEYVPFRGIFGFLETVVPIGDFSAGEEYTVFNLNRVIPASMPQAGIRQAEGARFSVLICFEDIFPQISRQLVKKEADFLINITNDAWFGNTSSPYQHLSASVFRAVENGVYLVRAANTGISGFITPEGIIYPLTDKIAGKQTFISGYLTKEIFLSPKQYSFYTHWGDWFVLVCLILAIYGILKHNFKKGVIKH